MTIGSCNSQQSCLVYLGQIESLLYLRLFTWLIAIEKRYTCRGASSFSFDWGCRSPHVGLILSSIAMKSFYFSKHFVKDATMNTKFIIDLLLLHACIRWYSTESSFFQNTRKLIITYTWPKVKSILLDQQFLLFIIKLCSNCENIVNFWLPFCNLRL